MEQLNPHSVLVTGSNRGLGLEFIRQLVGKKTAPKWIFATCRDPAGPRAQDLRNLAAEHPQIVIITLAEIYQERYGHVYPSPRAMVNAISEGLEGEARGWLATLHKRRGPQLHDVDDFLQGGAANLRFEVAQETTPIFNQVEGLPLIRGIMDTDDPSSIKAAAAKATECLKGAGLNLLINNAGIINRSTLETETPENMVVTYRTNLTGPMIVVQVFLPLLRKAAQESSLEGMSCRKAAIVNISSEAGSITNVLEWQRSQSIAYRCSKSALNMLSRCQSLHLAKDEILCIALHPGWVATDMGGRAGIAPLTTEQSVRGILNTLGHLSEKNTGTFLNWEGNLVPW